MDYNARINWVCVGQVRPDPDAQNADTLYVVKSMFKKTPERIESLIQEFNRYYAPHRRRNAEITYFYDATAKQGKNYVEYETDSDLRDSEKIPVKEDIYAYFQREVRPYVADAWINLPATKIGCEISFNKYFYKPAPLRTLEENEADIRALDEQSQGFIKSLFEIL